MWPTVNGPQNGNLTEMSKRFIGGEVFNHYPSVTHAVPQRYVAGDALCLPMVGACSTERGEGLDVCWKMQTKDQLRPNYLLLPTTSTAALTAAAASKSTDVANTTLSVVPAVCLASITVPLTILLLRQMCSVQLQLGQLGWQQL